jgi:formylglycine-generating enzyme required for sulfatase activity
MKNTFKQNVTINLRLIAIIAFAALIGFSLPSCATGNSDEITSSTGIVMVSVPGGSFQMGNPDTSIENTDNERPVHTVALTGFKMGKYEVTQEQFQKVMGYNQSFFQESPATGEKQARRPVDALSWYDALVFCNKLSLKEGLTPAYSISGSTDPAAWGEVPRSINAAWDAAIIVEKSNGYRLPTEAQWEYAARGGNGSPGSYVYAGSNQPDDVAWYGGNSDGITHEVGKKKPNGLGLYDMSGNVYEWCWDRYKGYSSEAQTNPIGASSGSDRVLRGGCFYNYTALRSTYRYNHSDDNNQNDPSKLMNNIGLRLVLPE